MVGRAQKAKAVLLRMLHDHGTLVLPNVWDAGSAVLIARAGAKAIATTSGGVAWSAGLPDGQHMTGTEMVEQVRQIAAAVVIPVTADIEAGYGDRPEDVRKTIEAVVAAGAVGVNVEDSRAPGGPLFDVAAQAERVRAGRSAAARAGLPELLINVRTDVFLFSVGAAEHRLRDVLARSSAYAEAGADCLFAPGLTDLGTVASLVKESPLPVNVMAGPGTPTVAELASAGVRRVSVGTAISQAAYSVAYRAATELLTEGTYGELDGALDFAAINRMFIR